MLRLQRRQQAGTLVRKLWKRQRRSQPSGHPCRDRRTSGTSHCGSRMASCTQPCQYSLACKEEFSRGYLANLSLPFGGPESSCRPELTVKKHIPYFIKSQPLHLAAPCKRLQEAVQIFRSIPESRQVFAYHNDDVRAHFLCFADELQLVQASTTSFIIAGYNDLFLLDRQRQRLERRILILDYGSIETVIVLPAAAALAV